MRAIARAPRHDASFHPSHAMSATPAIDDGQPIDWSCTSADYAVHRPGPPERLYDLLGTLGVGLRGQRVLDVGTGTGLVARALAARGVSACGIDIAPGQIEAA